MKIKVILAQDARRHSYTGMTIAALIFLGVLGGCGGSQIRSNINYISNPNLKNVPIVLDIDHDIKILTKAEEVQKTASQKIDEMTGWSDGRTDSYRVAYFIFRTPDDANKRIKEKIISAANSNAKEFQYSVAEPFYGKSPRSDPEAGRPDERRGIEKDDIDFIRKNKSSIFLRIHYHYGFPNTGLKNGKTRVALSGSIVVVKEGTWDRWEWAREEHCAGDSIAYDWVETNQLTPAFVESYFEKNAPLIVGNCVTYLSEALK